MKLTICLLAMLCAIQGISQPKALLPGDTIPAFAWNKYDSPADPGKGLLILDFWATWCGSCLKKFPHLDSLQQQFGNRLNLLLVNSRKTGDDTAKINALLNRLQQAGQPVYRLTMLVNDTILDKYFPHMVLPHYVWIYQNRYIAATNAAAVTGDNINAVLQGLPCRLEQKNDALRRQQLLQQNLDRKKQEKTANQNNQSPAATGKDTPIYHPKP